MQLSYSTNLLYLNTLTVRDADFIYELVNTEGWKKFIGDRNIKNIEDANQYIQKIISNVDVNYWVVNLQQNNTPIGIITLIKRPYLSHYDIGFAFLPSYTKCGYAFEATLKVLFELLHSGKHSLLFATTLAHNIPSIALLNKLGFIFEKQITYENDTLQLYSITKDRLVSGM